MKQLQYCILILSLIMISCHYKKDKLKIKNNSKKDIYYHLILKYKNEDKYYGPFVGGQIKPNKFDSPGVRGTILYEMQTNSFNKILYVVYFNVKDREYVYKNEKTIIFNKKFYIEKYSLKELDSLNWIISYPKKN